MKRFYCGVAGLLLILTLSVAATQLPRGLVRQRLSTFFTNPDGTPCQQPCLFGVQPTMTYEQALMVLQTHLGVGRQHSHVNWEAMSLIEDRFTGNAITVVLTYYRTRYLGVSVSFSPETTPIQAESEVQLGDVLTSLGVPQTFVPADNEAWLIYHYGELIVLTRLRLLQTKLLNPTDPLLTIRLVQVSEDYNVLWGQARRWCGLGSAPNRRRCR
jgi:hypothetical protein